MLRTYLTFERTIMQTIVINCDIHIFILISEIQIDISVSYFPIELTREIFYRTWGCKIVNFNAITLCTTEKMVCDKI